MGVHHRLPHHGRRDRGRRRRRARQADPHRLHPPGRLARGAADRGAIINHSSATSAAVWSGSPARAPAWRSSTRTVHPRRAAHPASQHDRRGAAQRRVGVDLVDRGAHHPRRGRREPGAAARGRGHRRHRARLRRAVAGPRLPLGALHVRRRPVRRRRRDRRRARDRNGGGATLRTTRLRDVQGVVWHVPNGEIHRVGNKSNCGHARSSTWRSATTPTSTPRST